MQSLQPPFFKDTMNEYIRYCKNLKLDPLDGQSAKMYFYYKEASKASTDFAKKDDMYGTPIPAYTTITSNCVSFAPYPYPQVECTVPCDYLAPKKKCEPNKKEKTMYVDNDKHIESSKINYLNDRASQVFYKKADELPRKFGLEDDAAPRSVSDFIKRIQDGKFTIKDETKKDVEGYFYRPLDGIRWRDPSVKEDKDGHKAAYDSLSAAYQDAKDNIAIGTPVEGLAAVKALEAWTPTAK